MSKPFGRQGRKKGIFVIEKTVTINPKGWRRIFQSPKPTKRYFQINHTGAGWVDLVEARPLNWKMAMTAIKEIGEKNLTVRKLVKHKNQFSVE